VSSPGPCVRRSGAVDNVNSNSGAYYLRFSHCALDRGTVAEMQDKAVEKRERNLPPPPACPREEPQGYHHRLELNFSRFLRVFNVRSAGSIDDCLLPDQIGSEHSPLVGDGFDIMAIPLHGKGRE